MLGALCPRAEAAPNGLTQIPIAKVFADGVASFSLARSEQSSKTTTYTTQYGIDNKLEVGLDYQAAPSEQRTLLSNVKYLVAHRPGRLPDMAFGLANLATGQKAIPYFVATTQPRATGFSLGAIRPNNGGAYYGMAGISYSVTPTIQIVGDEIGGRADYSTIGVIASLTRTVSLNVAYAQPNTAGSAADGFVPRGYVVNLAYTFHLKGSEKGGSGAGQPKPGAGNTGGTGK